MEMGEEEKKKKKMELIHVALRQIMEERRKDKVGKHQEEESDEQGVEDSLLLSRLLSKLESLENDSSTTHLPKESSDGEEPSSSAPPDARDRGTREVGMDEIVRELKRVRRQNLITHCLLSVMIAVTAFWQFSEVSMLLTVKEKFSNPLRAVGDMIAGSLKGPDKKHAIETTPLPPIAVPELPHMDLPSLTLNSHED